LKANFHRRAKEYAGDDESSQGIDASKLMNLSVTATKNLMFLKTHNYIF